MEIFLIKQMDNTFKVAYPSDYDKMKKLKAGELLKCKISQPRNLKFHRKLMALVNCVYENQMVFKNVDHLRKELTIAAGFYEVYTDLEGNEKKEAQSISFASMAQDEFNELYERFMDVVLDVYNFDRELMENVLDDFT